MKIFDRLFAEAALLIAEGRHQRDAPPADGGRWPVSVVLRPDDASAERLEQVMTQAETLTGPGHFRTGSAGSLHITVRALEGYRDAAGQDDEVVKRYAVAMRRAARQVEEIELELVGLTLTSGTVMVCASPVDDNAELVRFRYEDSAHGRRMRPEVLASVRTGRPQPMSAGRP